MLQIDDAARERAAQVETHLLPRRRAKVTGIDRFQEMLTSNGDVAVGMLALAVQTNHGFRHRLKAFFAKESKWLEPGTE
jgi:hypothetical protein